MLRAALLSGLGGITMMLNAQSPVITGYEYWFNQDDANRVFVPAGPAPTVTLDHTLDTEALPNGTHQVHLRLKDQGPGGVVRWSSVVTRTLQKHHGGPWEIVAVRYWVGEPANSNDPGIRYKWFDTPQTSIEYDGVLDLCDLPTGGQTLKLQLLDNHGQWSSVVTRSVTIQTAGTLGPPSISASPSTFCPGDTVIFMATAPPPPGNATPSSYTWTFNGLTPVSSSTESTISAIVGSTSGTVQVYTSNYCGTSSTASFNVSIPSIPAQPSAIQHQGACMDLEAEFSVTAVPDITYQWNAPGGNPATGGPGATFSTTLSGNTNITVTPVNACGVPGPARTVAITVTAPPNAGTNGSLTVCSDSEAANLFGQLGGSPQGDGTWSGPSPIMGGMYNPGTMNPGTYVYTVSGSGPCPNATASVQVVENQAPNAGVNGTLTVCSNAAPISLFDQLGGNPDAGGTWTGPSTTSGTFNPSSMLPGPYTYTVPSIAPCTDANATVNVAVTPAPNAGMDGTLTLCSNDEPDPLFAHLGGTPDAGGTWSPDVPNGMYDPATMDSGDFTYTVIGVAPCADATAIVSVVETPLPSIEVITAPEESVLVGGIITFSVAPITGATYIWTLPSDWTGSSTSHEIEVTVGGDPHVTDSVRVQVVVEPCDTVEAWIVVEVDGGVGVTAAEAGTGISLFPNPGRDLFTVSFEGQRHGLYFEVVDLVGRRVADLGMRTARFTMDLSHLASGTYLLRWTDGEDSGQLPVVVQR